MVCILGMGDCGAKATTSLSVDMSTTVAQIAKTLTSTSQASTTSVVNANKFKIVVGGSIINSTIKNNQTINSNVKISTELTTQTKNQISQDVQATMKATVNQAASAQSGFLATAGSTSKNTATFNNAVNTSLSTENITKTISDTYADIVNTNSNEIFIGKDLNGSYIDNNQDIANQLVSIAIVNQLVDNLNTQLAKDGFDGQITQSATAKSGGIAELVSAIFQGPAMLVGISVCAALCCCLLIVIALVGISYSPAGQAAVNKGTDLASVYAMGKMK